MPLNDQKCRAERMTGSIAVCRKRLGGFQTKRGVFCFTYCFPRCSGTSTQIPEVEEENSREGGSTSSSPEEELTRRLENTMRRIFWDRFTQSLLPPPPPRPNQSPSGGSEGGVGRKGEGEMKGEIGGEELRVGSQVHARYGSDRGSYYSATVISVTRERSGGGSGGDGGDGDREGVFVDVRYNEDGVVERGVSAVRRLKKRRDPPDFGPLLSLLREVGDKRFWNLGTRFWTNVCFF